MTAIGNDDELKWTGRAPSKARPAGGVVCPLGQSCCQLDLRRPGDHSYLAHSERRRLVLGCVARGGEAAPVYPTEEMEKEECYEARGLRGTSPPAAATSSISWHRLAHGLNLLAL